MKSSIAVKKVLPNSIHHKQGMKFVVTDSNKKCFGYGANCMTAVNAYKQALAESKAFGY